MNNSIIPVTPGLLALLSKGHTGVSPFTQEIFLLEIQVAGTYYAERLPEVEYRILPEQVLTMKREPNNQYDEHAIALYIDEVRVGYVPANLNLVCSRLMDAGNYFLHAL
jgi:HIRAN domain